MRLWRFVAAALWLASQTAGQPTRALVPQQTSSADGPQQTKAVAAQQASAAPPQTPECALPCRQIALRETKCPPRDLQCICKDPDFAKAMAECVTSRCTIKESLIVKNASSIACGEPIRDYARGFVPLNDAFVILASLFVIQRFAFKIWTKMTLGTDDWMTLAALVLSLPSAVFNSHVLAPNGMGRDAWTLSFDQITTFIRFFSIEEILYFLDIAVSKLALLFFYLRIFSSTSVRRILLASIVFVGLFGVAFVIVAILQCQPVSYAWDKWNGEHQGHCLNIGAMVKSHAIISIALDFWMLAIPLRQLRHVRIDWQHKVGVALMFSVGTFVTIVSILRFRATNFTSHTTNPTRDFFEIGLWSMIEINVGIMCVCLPSLRLLLARLFPLLTSSTQRYYSKQRRTPPGAYVRALLASEKSQNAKAGSALPSQRSLTPDANQIQCEKTFPVTHMDRREEDEQQLITVKMVSSSRGLRPRFS
ncbi:hypothetical protein HIM_11674 [Hirsutella minnesotensis 3608]|uniref:CFEM domain-containing protein n=1 Tax=Hirsutella minnesotensis 3608 TaxID=1043627 RepID=A0A0F7ZFD1_9HYPO|nr:hypothetical protein HIM_11674 [Hirsutella minnesotensis 3608]